MEIDTGASAPVISEEIYGKLSNNKTLALCKSSVKLRTYTSEVIPETGSVTVNIAYYSQTAEAHLLVVKERGLSLLERNWASNIQLNGGEIRRIEGFCAEDGYPDVFKDELGTLRGTTVKLYVKPNATPCFFKPRSVPYKVKHKVEQDLARVQQLGVYEFIQFSNWAAPIVPVP